MAPEDDYVVKHYRVTDWGLEWVKCAPVCAHNPEPDVHHGGLQIGLVSADQIEWLG